MKTQTTQTKTDGKTSPYKTLRHTFNKNLPYPVEVKIHLNTQTNQYWFELNGCQESGQQEVPNMELKKVCCICNNKGNDIYWLEIDGKFAHKNCADFGFKEGETN